MENEVVQWGLALAVLGGSIAVIFGGIGSAIGVGLAGQAGAGVTAEKPELFGKVLVLEALPATQGIYGFLVGFLALRFPLLFRRRKSGRAGPQAA